jgi:large subunit ribosomal protein L28
MATCSLTGKRWMNGNKVSHSNIKSAKRFDANIQKKRVFDPETGRWVRLKISTRALKSLNKKSLSEALRSR